MFYREAGQFRTSYAQDSQIFPLRQDRIGIAVILIAALLLPFVANAYWLSAILIPWLVLSLVALGQNILMGYAGQLSLGSAGFMAVACPQHTINVAMPIPIVRVRHLRGAGSIVRIRARFLYPYYPFCATSSSFSTALSLSRFR